MIKEVVEENIIQILTYNVANYNANGELIMTKRKVLY